MDTTLKKLLFILLFLLAHVSFAVETQRDELVLEVAKLLNIYTMVDSSINEYQNRINSRLKEADKKELKRLFDEYRTNIIATYLDSINKQSTQELKRLIKFYSSEEGKWYLNKRFEMNRDAQSSQVLVQKDFETKLNAFMSKKSVGN